MSSRQDENTVETKAITATCKLYRIDFKKYSVAYKIELIKLFSRKKKLANQEE